MIKVKLLVLAASLAMIGGASAQTFTGPGGQTPNAAQRAQLQRLQTQISAKPVRYQDLASAVNAIRAERAELVVMAGPMPRELYLEVFAAGRRGVRLPLLLGSDGPQDLTKLSKPLLSAGRPFGTSVAVTRDAVVIVQRGAQGFTVSTVVSPAVAATVRANLLKAAAAPR